MEYLSSFYWQQESPAETSLVLQHFVYRKGKKPGLFTCICTEQVREETGEVPGNVFFLNGLHHWFQGEGRKQFLKEKGESASETGIRLERLLEQLDREWGVYLESKCQTSKRQPDLIGLICQDERFLLFYRGDKVKAYLMNKRFGRTHCKCLTEQESISKLQIAEGRMESGIAVLIATAEYSGSLSEKQLKECLSVQEMTRTENVKARLRELGEEAVRQGGRHMGAVLVLTGKQFEKGQ